MTHDTPLGETEQVVGAIVLGQELKIDWKEALAVQKEIKHQMQLDYLRTGRGRPHIEWRWWVMLGFAEPYVNCIFFREQARHLSNFQTLAKLGPMPFHVHPYKQDKWDFGPVLSKITIPASITPFIPR
jgi:hypothetical protein